MLHIDTDRLVKMAISRFYCIHINKFDRKKMYQLRLKIAENIF